MTGTDSKTPLSDSVDSFIAFILEVGSQPRYSHGWILFGILSIIPAIISGNVLQHTLTKLWRKEKPLAEVAITLLLNLMGLIFFTAIIAISIYL